MKKTFKPMKVKRLGKINEVVLTNNGKSGVFNDGNNGQGNKNFM